MLLLDKLPLNMVLKVELRVTLQLADHLKLMEGGPKKIGLRSIIRLMPNAASGQVAIEYGAKGRAKSDATACRSLKTYGRGTKKNRTTLYNSFDAQCCFWTSCH